MSLRAQATDRREFINTLKKQLTTFNNLLAFLWTGIATRLLRRSFSQ